MIQFFLDLYKFINRDCDCKIAYRDAEILDVAKNFFSELYASKSMCETNVDFCF